MRRRGSRPAWAGGRPDPTTPRLDREGTRQDAAAHIVSQGRNVTTRRHRGRTSHQDEAPRPVGASPPWQSALVVMARWRRGASAPDTSGGAWTGAVRPWSDIATRSRSSVQPGAKVTGAGHRVTAVRLRSPGLDGTQMAAPQRQDRSPANDGYRVGSRPRRVGRGRSTIDPADSPQLIPSGGGCRGGGRGAPIRAHPAIGTRR